MRCSSQKPRATTAYPEAPALTAGAQMMLALEPYRIFLAELPADAVDSDTRQVRWLSVYFLTLDAYFT